MASIDLSEEIISQYKNNGAVLLKGVFEKQWVKLIEKGIRSVQNDPSPFGQSIREKDGEGVYFNDYFNWKNIPQFTKLIFESPAAHIASQLMESEYSIFYHEHVLTKEAGTSKATPWHHDQSYYPVDGNQIVSLWIPVDFVGMESAIRFVKGSHSWNKWFRPKMFKDELNYEDDAEDEKQNQSDSIKMHSFEDVPVDEIDSGKFGSPLAWETEPGDAIAFHGRTIHGAPGNKCSNRHRRVLSLRWLGEDAVMANRPWKPSPPRHLHAGLKCGEKVLIDKTGTFPIVWKSKLVK